MFHRIATIAYGTFREAVRARILLGLAGVAFAAAFYSLVVAAFTLNEAPRVVADLGAMVTNLFSIVVAVLIGATSLHRELEMKTILPILARPVARHEYLVGKYLGIMLVVATFVLAESGLALMMTSVLGGRSPLLVVGVGATLAVVLAITVWRLPSIGTAAPIPWAVAMVLAGSFFASSTPGERSLVCASALLSFMEVAIIAGLAMLFSAFSTPFLSALLTVGMFAVGRSADTMARMPVKVFGPLIRDLGLVLSRIVPNLHVYVPARPLLTGEAVDANLAGYLAYAGVQTLGWMIGLLAVSAFIFQRRDFT
ncbi:MAG: ABC transporter permease subunit [Deltaproteobacteria bacterium]|nr:ABC transporter permease subunit [Deltaproteobacteria bacterium]